MVNDREHFLFQVSGASVVSVNQQAHCLVVIVDFVEPESKHNHRAKLKEINEHVKETFGIGYKNVLDSLLLAFALKVLIITVTKRGDFG